MKSRKEANEKYRRSEKGKLAEKKYSQTEKFKVTQKRYKQSEKGKIVAQRLYEKAKGISDMQYIKYNGRARSLKERYGISPDDYNKIAMEQKGICAICGNVETRIKVHRSGRVSLNPLCVDHSHIDGKIRGLLCNKCNSGIALFCENVEYLANAISYLEKHKIVSKQLVGAGT